MGYTLLRLALILALAALFAGLGWRVCRAPAEEGQAPGAAAPTACAALGLLAILVQYAAPRHYVDWLQLPPGLWRDALFAPGALLVGVACARAWGNSRQRVLTALLGLGYAGFLLHDPVFVLVHASANLEPPEIKDGVVLQRNDRNCAPASAATVLRRWGLEASDGELALLAQTSYYGTPDDRLVEAIRSYGAEAGLDALAIRTTWDELRAIDHPAILGVKLLGSFDHAVALLGLADDGALFGEPLVGRQSFVGSSLVLLSEWKRWDGKAIVVGRDFVHDLGPGDRDAKLAELRPVLGLTAEPVFDAELEQAVRAFQSERGLPVSGRLEPKTILALHALRDRGEIPSLRWTPSPADGASAPASAPR